MYLLYDWFLRRKTFFRYSYRGYHDTCIEQVESYKKIEEDEAEEDKWRSRNWEYENGRVRNFYWFFFNEVIYWTKWFFKSMKNRSLLKEQALFVKKIYAKIEARKKLEEEEDLKKDKLKNKKKKIRIKTHLILNEKTGYYSKPKKPKKRSDKKYGKKEFIINHLDEYLAEFNKTNIFPLWVIKLWQKLTRKFPRFYPILVRDYPKKFVKTSHSKKIKVQYSKEVFEVFHSSNGYLYNWYLKIRSIYNILKLFFKSKSKIVSQNNYIFFNKLNLDTTYFILLIYSFIFHFTSLKYNSKFFIFCANKKNQYFNNYLKRKKKFTDWYWKIR